MDHSVSAACSGTIRNDQRLAITITAQLAREVVETSVDRAQQIARVRITTLHRGHHSDVSLDPLAQQADDEQVCVATLGVAAIRQVAVDATELDFRDTRCGLFKPLGGRDLPTVGVDRRIGASCVRRHCGASEQRRGEQNTPGDSMGAEPSTPGSIVRQLLRLWLGQFRHRAGMC